MTSLTDIAVTNRSVTREPQYRQGSTMLTAVGTHSPVSRVRDWVCGRLGPHFFRIPKFLR
jgi:hypothetical protein